MEKIFNITTLFFMSLVLFVSLITQAEAQNTLDSYRPDGESAHITLSEYYLVPEGSVRVSGGEFAPNETVIVSVLGKTQVAETDASGRFETNAFIVGFQASETNTVVRARGLTSGASETTVLSVGTYYPVVEASDYYVTSGESVTFTGEGFVPHEQVIVSTKEGAIEESSADASGDISVSVAPPQESDSHRYTFTGAESNTSYQVIIHTASGQ